jgi:hypothetical protein
LGFLQTAFKSAMSDWIVVWELLWLGVMTTGKGENKYVGEGDQGIYVTS